MSLGMKVFLFLLVWSAGVVPVAFVMFMLVGPCHSTGDRIAAAQSIGGLWFLGLFVGPVLVASAHKTPPPRAKRPRLKLPAKDAGA